MNSPLLGRVEWDDQWGPASPPHCHDYSSVSSSAALMETFAGRTMWSSQHPHVETLQNTIGHKIDITLPKCGGRPPPSSAPAQALCEGGPPHSPDGGGAEAGYLLCFITVLQFGLECSEAVLCSLSNHHRQNTVFLDTAYLFSKLTVSAITEVRNKNVQNR